MDIADSNVRQSQFMHEHQDEPNVSGPDVNDVWNLTAVRSYLRLFAIRTEGWWEAEGCDRQYDDGEWSGPAWAKNWEDAEHTTVDHVAERFDVDACDLYDWIQFYVNQQMHLEMDAMMTMTRRTT